MKTIKDGTTVYEDRFFNGNVALYGDDAARFDAANNGYDLGVSSLYSTDVSTGELYWQRAFSNGGNFALGKVMGSDKWSGDSDVYDTSYNTPRTNTLLSNTFNDNNLVTAMAAVAEFPNLMGEIVRI